MSWDTDEESPVYDFREGVPTLKKMICKGCGTSVVYDEEETDEDMWKEIHYECLSDREHGGERCPYTKVIPNPNREAAHENVKEYYAKWYVEAIPHIPEFVTITVHSAYSADVPWEKLGWKFVKRLLGMDGDCGGLGVCVVEKDGKFREACSVGGHQDIYDDWGGPFYKEQMVPNGPWTTMEWESAEECSDYFYESFGS